MKEEFFKVYFSHEFGGKKENLEHMGVILDLLYKGIGVELNSLSIFPVSPLHALGFAYHYTDYEYGMELCLELLSQCSMMVTIDGYDNSRGVNIEKQFCKDNNIPVLTLTQFITFIEQKYIEILGEKEAL